MAADYTAEQIAELEAKHGECHKLREKRGKWCLVVRNPKPQEYKMARRMMHDPAKKAEATEELLKLVTVAPTGAEFDALMTRYPMLPELCANALQQIMGGELEVAEK